MSGYEEKEEKSRDYDVADSKEDIVQAVRCRVLLIIPLSAC